MLLGIIAGSFLLLLHSLYFIFQKKKKKKWFLWILHTTSDKNNLPFHLQYTNVHKQMQSNNKNNKFKISFSYAHSYCYNYIYIYILYGNYITKISVGQDMLSSGRREHIQGKKSLQSLCSISRDRATTK